MEFRIPEATYRLQFNSQFTFNDACELLPYLDQLGVTEVYASPIFKSRRGSSHGYDVIDPTQLNPELGTEAELETLTKEIGKHNLGLLLDIVPNHMGISSDNPFWMDVLKNGQKSHYAEFFDIDWVACDGVSKNKILLPILGKPYGQALEDGEISLTLEDDGFFIHYFETKLPLSLESSISLLTHELDSPETERDVDHGDLKHLKQILGEMKHLAGDSPVKLIDRNEIKRSQLEEQIQDLTTRSSGIKDLVKRNITWINGEKGNPRSFDQLDNLLNQQFYRLAYWRTATDELNYRRFFDINTLIGVRVEIPEVMQVTHKLILRLVREGQVTGLRIDHIDGLNDPAAYLLNLRQNTGRFYSIVEKILTGDETLPGKWPVYGTTGYEFAREVNRIFIDSEGQDKLAAQYSEMRQRKIEFADVVYEKKRQVIEELFYGEVHSLGCRLFELAQQDRYARDLTERKITWALIELTANLPVYRTYIRSFEVSPVDRRYLEQAWNESFRRIAETESPELDFLRRIFLLEFPADFGLDRKQSWLALVMKWQQLTGPVTAKGLEDTALYAYNPLISLNVIGAALRPQKWLVEQFHNFNMDRQTHWPLTLNATSTHDTKRSEDVQARIDVLSEFAKLWLAHFSWWSHLNYNRKKQIAGQEVPDPDTENFLYQSLIGAWPLNNDEIPEFKERFKQYMLKAVREAKIHTSWLHPDEDYEKAMADFVEAVLTESEQNDFTEAFVSFQREISFYGAVNSLSQTLLKIVSPGVPDIYQGLELWDFSLVDPDNRRPVDFKKRIELLKELIEQEEHDRPALLEDLLDHWQDGRVKLYLTYKALNFRLQQRPLFQTGDYMPLIAEGKRDENVVAFIRRKGDIWLIAAVPRMVTRLAQPGNFPIGKRSWGKDRLVLPDGSPLQWKNILTGESINLMETDQNLLLSRVFATFPVSLLTNLL